MIIIIICIIIFIIIQCTRRELVYVIACFSVVFGINSTSGTG